MPELASLKKQRSTNKTKLTNIIKFVNSIDDRTDVEVIRIRISRVDSLMTEFTHVEKCIFDVSDQEESDFEFEEKYYHAKAKLNSIIRKRSMVQGIEVQTTDMTMNTSHSGQTEVKLPKIFIPQFFGDYTEWQSFYDLFATTIHDSTILSAVQKFQYLKGSLRGEAAALLRHISVTEANYIEALNKLKDRYDRKKHIMNSFIRTFVDHPPIQNANASKMKNLLDSADEVVRGLKALGPAAEARDPWLVYWLVNKLDDKSKCMWAETSADNDNPSLDDFFKFLTERIDALESLNYAPKSGHSKAVRGHVAASEPVAYACSFCQNKDHSIFDCSEFNDLNVNQRRDWIKRDKRCFNCLSRRHAIFNCQSRRPCRTCSNKHHTLLHINTAGKEESLENHPSTSTENARSILKSVQLADPEFYQPGPIDMLLGADHFFSILLDGRKTINQYGLTLQNTIFGWVISGRYIEDPESTSSFVATNTRDADYNLDTTLKRFWELESVGEGKTTLSTEEQLCEKHFANNTTRNHDGRLIVSLPFIQFPDDLSSTLNLAIQRLRSMERRFERDPEFKQLYHDFMEEYEHLHHMEKIPTSEIMNDGHYLPHHGVLRKASASTKLRVVFDGSAKTNSGHSLNHYLAVGPTIHSQACTLSSFGSESTK